MAKFSQYSTFVAVVETGSLSGAAKLLNVSPSAVSKQLNALEASTKTQLFDRSHRNVRATEPGLRFYEQCKSILQAVTVAEDELLEEQEAITGRLSLTISKSLIRSPLFDLIAECSALYPEIRFDIHFSDHVEDLHEAGLDFAFRLGRLDDSSRLYAVPLMDVRLTICATQKYLDQYGQPESFSELSKHRLILMSPESLSVELKQFLKKQNMRSDSRHHHTTNDIEAVYQAVRSGMAIGMMLDVSIQDEMQSGEFIPLLADKKMPSKKLYLIHKKSGKFLQKQKVFKEFIRKSFKNSN
ncbi:MAG: LysR family transcriptional regulator [Methyloligellaceae bacterium]